MDNNGMRTDIQALRGWAVLMVVLHHVKLPYLQAGYLGVDIFFVISGFLITRLITSAIARGEFSFREFYFRRAKRLLPAAYVTFLATAILAPWFLNAAELHDFALQLVGALTFSGNIVLWQQSDYFRSASELKPLLHVWSLAVEEQYYFVLPALLAFTAPQRWLRWIAALSAASLLLCLAGGMLQPTATFYLFPTRAWEMGIGSLAALLASSGGMQRLARPLFWPALAACALLPFAGAGGNHPGAAAFVICCATAAILVRCHPRLQQAAALQPLARLGDMSYSLYLVHWPIIAFANNAWVGETAGQLSAAAQAINLALSFLLAWALHRWVEEPARHARLTLSRRALAGTVTASAGLAAIAVAMLAAPARGTDYAFLFRPNYGMDRQCQQTGSFAPLAACSTSAAPKILVWGDSYAMHLVPGLADSGRLGLVQATGSLCGPLLNMAPIAIEAGGNAGNFAGRWSKDCIDFNDSVLRYLAQAASVEVVVLASPFVQYLDAGKYHSLQRSGAGMREAPAGADSAVAGLHATVQAVRRLGKRVVLVAPPPSGGFNAAGCHERAVHGQLRFGAPGDCQIPEADYHRQRQAVHGLLARVRREADLEVLSFDDFLCRDGVCMTALDGVPLYRDAGHFSYAGSKLVAARMGLEQKLAQLAR